MKREIKFRGKRIDNGEWVEGHYSEGSKDYHYITTSFGNIRQINPETVGQYTGLKDKNGVEIYEGDILHYFEHAGYLFSVTNMIVCWNDEYAGFGYKAENMQRFFTSFWDHDELKSDVLQHCEVIGNIHDKPEMK